MLRFINRTCTQNINEEVMRKMKHESEHLGHIKIRKVCFQELRNKTYVVAQIVMRGKIESKKEIGIY